MIPSNQFFVGQVNEIAHIKEKILVLFTGVELTCERLLVRMPLIKATEELVTWHVSQLPRTKSVFLCI